MKNRFAALKPYFDGGNVGETNKGLVEVRDEAGLNLQAKAALRNLVKDENGDRTKLYAEVAKALNIEASQIERIQKIFAENWIKSAAARLVGPAGRRRPGSRRADRAFPAGLAGSLFPPVRPCPCSRTKRRVPHAASAFAFFGDARRRFSSRYRLRTRTVGPRACR